MADSTRYNVGSVTRTVNIPTLALMFLHPDIRPRFTFTHEGDETVAGRAAWVIEYHERERPTLIKTTRGRDLAVTGKLWVEPATGIVREDGDDRRGSAGARGRDHDLSRRRRRCSSGCRARWTSTTSPAATCRRAHRLGHVHQLPALHGEYRRRAAQTAARMSGESVRGARMSKLLFGGALTMVAALGGAGCANAQTAQNAQAATVGRRESRRGRGHGGRQEDHAEGGRGEVAGQRSGRARPYHAVALSASPPEHRRDRR